MRTTTVRRLLPESWGFLCPVHTPDGEPCGLMNHLTAICEVVTQFVYTASLPALLCNLGTWQGNILLCVFSLLCCLGGWAENSCRNWFYLSVQELGWFQTAFNMGSNLWSFFLHLLGLPLLWVAAVSLCRKTVKNQVVHTVPGSLGAAGMLSCVLFVRCGTGFGFTFTHNDALSLGILHSFGILCWSVSGVFTGIHISSSS